MYFWHNKHIHIAVSSCMKTLMLSKGGSTTLWLITIENKYIFVGAYVLIPNSTYYLSYSSHKDDVIDIADPGSTHDAYHMNFVRDLAHHSLCGPVVKHRCTKSEGIRFDSSWGLRIFSLSHALDKISLFLYRAQNLPSLLF